MENRNDMMGHNNPPVIDEAYEALAARGKELADAAERIPNADEPEASQKLATYVKIGKEYLKAVNAWHKETKAPFLEKSREVDTAKNSAIAIIDGGMKKANDQLQIIADKLAREETERQRIAAEAANKARLEAERLEREAQDQNDAVASAKAAQAQKDAKKAEKEAQAQTSSIRTDEGAQVSFKKVWTHEIENYNQIPVSILRKYLGDDAFDKAMRAAVKDGQRDIKGVHIFQKTTQAVR